MTYGMLVIILLLTCFSAVVGFILTMIRIKIKIKKNEQKAELLSDMAIFVNMYLNIKKDDHISKFPCIEEYLDKSFETISEIIAQKDFDYDRVKIGRYKDDVWLIKLVKEISRANKEMRKVVNFNMNLVENMYRYKNPFRYFFDSHKKKVAMRILEILVLIIKNMSKDKEKAITRTGKGKQKLESNVVRNEMGKEIVLA